MTVAAIDTAAPELVRGRGGGGPAPKRVIVAYGFWIFILSDMVTFSGMFAADAVLSGNTAGGPTGSELFNLHNVFIETLCLLFSSYTCGLGALSAERRQPARFLIFAGLTFVPNPTGKGSPPSIQSSRGYALLSVCRCASGSITSLMASAWSPA